MDLASLRALERRDEVDEIIQRVAKALSESAEGCYGEWSHQRRSAAAFVRRLDSTTLPSA